MDQLSLEKSLMAFRGLLMLTQLERLHDFGWGGIFGTILLFWAKLIKKNSRGPPIFIDFLTLTISKKRFLTTV